jgi:hypothetical protein
MFTGRFGPPAKVNPNLGALFADLECVSGLGTRLTWVVALCSFVCFGVSGMRIVGSMGSNWSISAVCSEVGS